MRTQAIILLSAAILLCVTLVSCNSDDEKCRDFGSFTGWDEATLSKVSSFRMYGPKKLDEPCETTCKNLKHDIGFEYAGRQACCCGKMDE